MAFPVAARAAGDLITAGIWNADLKDNINLLQTPIVAATGKIQPINSTYFSDLSGANLTSLTAANLSGTIASAVQDAITRLGKVATYNAIAAAGWGVPAIYGSGRATGQTAANASVASYTVGGADGSFLVSGNLNLTVATTFAFALTCHYTDETNTARTQTIPVMGVGVGQMPGGSVANPASGTGPYTGIPIHIRAKAGTTITVQTEIIAGGNFTSVTYNVEGLIQQVA